MDSESFTIDEITPDGKVRVTYKIMVDGQLQNYTHVLPNAQEAANLPQNGLPLNDAVALKTALIAFGNTFKARVLGVKKQTLIHPHVHDLVGQENELS